MPNINTLDPQPQSTTPPDAKHTIVRAFRHRNYRLFFGGQIISLVGTFLTQTATLWFVYRLTHSYQLMGTIAFLGQLPVFLLTPFAGVVADRVHRRRFIVWTQILSMVQSLGLAALAFYFGRGEHPNMHVLVPGLIGLAAFQGIVNAFDLPARQAFIVEIVTDRADLPNAIALNSTMVHGARMVGPAMAGLIIAFFGESMCFFLDGISYIAVILALLAMNVVPVPPRKRGSVAAEMMEGFKYAWNSVPIRTLLLFMALISLTGMPAVQLLMPVFGDFFGGLHWQRHDWLVNGLIGLTFGIAAFAGFRHVAVRRATLARIKFIAVLAGATACTIAGIAFLCQLVLSLWTGLSPGSLTYGFIGGLSGVGALTGAILLAARRSVVGMGSLTGWAVGVFGIAIIGFAFSRHLWLSLMIIPFAGWGMITAFACANTIVQTLVDDDKRGRVMSLFGLAFLGMAPFGSLLAGTTAKLLTPGDGNLLTAASRTMWIAGGIIIVGTLVYFNQLPAIRRAAKPVYVRKGILPEMADGLKATDELSGAE
jgi:MFS family permease